MDVGIMKIVGGASLEITEVVVWRRDRETPSWSPEGRPRALDWDT
jgi:hypothetical protein